MTNKREISQNQPNTHTYINRLESIGVWLTCTQCTHNHNQPRHNSSMTKTSCGKKKKKQSWLSNLLNDNIILPLTSPPILRPFARVRLYPLEFLCLCARAVASTCSFCVHCFCATLSISSSPKMTTNSSSINSSLCYIPKPVHFRYGRSFNLNASS